MEWKEVRWDVGNKMIQEKQDVIEPDKMAQKAR